MQPVTAAGFYAQLSRALPDSIRYLTSYLSSRVGIEFKIGRLSVLPTDIAVQLIGKKWVETGGRLQRNDLVQSVSDGFGMSHDIEPPNSTRHEVPMADYIPLVLLDATGRECYRTLVLLGSGQQDKPVRLPLVPGATDVVIDPLGAWSDNKADNHKRLARDR